MQYKVIDRLKKIQKRIQEYFKKDTIIKNDSCYFFQYPHPTFQQKRIYEKLKSGDIVMAHIPIPDIECERLEIKKNHRIRPYIIINCMNRGFYGVPATSNHKYKYNPECFTYVDTNNTLHYVSYFLVFNYEYVPLCNLIQKLGTLDIFEKERLQQRLINYRNKGNEIALLPNVSIKLCVGVILQGTDCTKWYIYSIWKNTLYLHPVYDSSHKEGQPIHYLDNKTCFIVTTTQKVESLDALDGYVPLWYCSIKTIERIEKVKKRKQKNRFNIQFVDMI